MKYETAICAHFLRAAQNIAAREDIRYYLNGVCIEIGEAEVRYVATDGHCMLVLRDRHAGGPPATIIVPRETIDLLPKRGSVALFYNLDGPRRECRLGDIMFKPFDAEFPDYRKVIPEQATKEWAHIQIDYMVRFEEAARTAFGEANSSHYVEFWPNGPTSVCLVTCGREDFTGGVMPFQPTGTPEFAQWVQHESSAVAA